MARRQPATSYLGAPALLAVLALLVSCTSSRDERAAQPHEVNGDGAGASLADCQVFLTLNGVEYYGISGVKMALAEPVGTGTIPPCYDTGLDPPATPEPSSEIEVHRILGIDPGDAVGAGDALFIAGVDSGSDEISAQVQALLNGSDKSRAPNYPLMGVPESSFSCTWTGGDDQPQPNDGDVEPVTGVVKEFMVCHTVIGADYVTNPSAYSTRYQVGSHGFNEIVTWLTDPEVRDVGSACFENMDYPQELVVATDQGAWTVAVPSDTCSHYPNDVAEWRSQYRRSLNSDQQP